MGAVHGVYLKYVGLSAISFAGYSYLLTTEDAADLLTVSNVRALLASKEAMKATIQSIQSLNLTTTVLRNLTIAMLKYSASLNGMIACLFKAELGMSLIGKNPSNGQLPFWSYILYFPFHLPSILYTRIHSRNDRKKTGDKSVPTASEVQKGWYVGGMYADNLNKEWGGIVDLTVEFPERCIGTTKNYKLVASWDGVPPTPAIMDEAATFAVQARKEGDVLIHCAHGRGRSTTLMCAALVKAGLFNTWEEAFEKGIKPQRRVCKLNRRMRATLTEWQRIYVDGKKES